MSCETARAEYVTALNEWLALNDRMKAFTNEYVGFEGGSKKPKPIGPEEFEAMAQLHGDLDKAHARYDRAWRAYAEVHPHHRD